MLKDFSSLSSIYENIDTCLKREFLSTAMLTVKERARYSTRASGHFRVGL